jgi:phosphatidylglycerol:prolipoprotein diacylglycerol transferase
VFHWYGLLVGLAAVVFWQRFEWLATRWQLNPAVSKNIWLGLIAALVGARLWHVWTDWSYYRSDLLQIVQPWQGGLSIFGAVLGGGLILAWLAGRQHWRLALDLLVLALPWSQAIGRIANWVNQELYGLPTTLPWAITIDEAHRQPDFMAFSRFHPLFAYEAIALIFAGWGLHSLSQKKSWQPGTGKLTWVYLAFYSCWRFFLDFLRTDRVIIGASLSLNQWVLLAVMLGCSWHWFSNMKKTALIRSRWLWSGIGLGIALLFGVWMGTATRASRANVAQLQATSDLETVEAIVLRGARRQVVLSQPLQLEVAKTTLSRAQGLGGRPSLQSDGMIFWFEKPALWQFWMKDMQFALDFVWLYQGRIVGFEHTVPTPPDKLSGGRVLVPPAPVDMVIELSAGKARELGLKVGDWWQFSQANFPN